MKWLFKLFTIGRNKVNEAGEKAVDNFVDIRREGMANVAAGEKHIADLRNRVEDAEVEVSLARNKIKDTDKRIIALKNVVDKAVAVNNDGDALEALAEIEKLEGVAASHQETVDVLQPLLEETYAEISRMETELADVRLEINKLDIQEKTYKARLKLAGGNLSGDMAFNMDDLRGRVAKVKATMEAKEAVKAKTKVGEDLVKKYSSGHKASTEERLATIKAANANPVLDAVTTATVDSMKKS